MAGFPNAHRHARLSTETAYRATMLWLVCSVAACATATEVAGPSHRAEPPKLTQSSRLELTGPVDAPGAPESAVEHQKATERATNGIAPLSAESDPVPERPSIRYPFHEPLPGPERIASAPARVYANYSATQCRGELRRRGLPTRPAPSPARGVATPLRLNGPLGNVRFVAPGARSVYGTLDCRLVLALHDFSSLLEEHGVTEVHIDNLYRPRARLPGRKYKRSQHAYGLAVDIMAVKLADGRTLHVEHDWIGTRQTPPCGPESELTDASEGAVLLRNIVCSAAREGLFHHVLTPNYDAAHEDHLHLDIKRDARAIVVR